MSKRSNPAQARLQRPAIVDTRRRIREQIKLIRTIALEGGDTDLATRVLRSMLHSLATLRWNEDLIAAQNETPDGPPPRSRHSSENGSTLPQASSSAARAIHPAAHGRSQDTR